MIPDKITLVNHNPNSPNAVRLGNGRFGGRVISRDHYYVYDVEPPFPLSYQLWIINDLQTQKRHINVSSQDGDKGERAVPDMPFTFYCQACDSHHCEHIRAVVVFEERKEKSIAAHAAKAKGFIDDLQMRFAFRNTREQHLSHLRVYANRHKVDFIELAREYEKYL